MTAPPSAATLPFRWYSDPEQLRVEQARIFASAWQYVGRVAAVAEPGAFFTATCGDVPVLVVRDRDGELRGFVNVCRHRGAVLLEGCGTRQTLQCHYHAWTYELDGSLRTAPRADREAGFDAAGLSLVPVAVDAWGPFVFANPDAAAVPLAEWLGPLPELLARDVDLDALVFRSRTHSSIAANWKIVVENFLECYHCPTAHPGFSEVVDTHPDRYALEPHPTFASQFCHTRAGGESGRPETGQFHLIWPNTAINIFPGPPNLSIGPIAPDGPERTTRFLDYFFAADADPGWIAEFHAFDDQVGREDVGLVESVQRGTRSGLVERGRLLLESEQLIAAFQSWVLTRLA